MVGFTRALPQSVVRCSRNLVMPETMWKRIIQNIYRFIRTSHLSYILSTLLQESRYSRQKLLRLLLLPYLTSASRARTRTGLTGQIIQKYAMTSDEEGTPEVTQRYRNRMSLSSTWQLISCLTKNTPRRQVGVEYNANLGTRQ